MDVARSKKTPPLFRLLTPDQTGVRFANTITTTDSENVQTDVYVYNGAGVAIGDIDNDGLPDIFFSANMVRSVINTTLPALLRRRQSMAVGQRS